MDDIPGFPWYSEKVKDLSQKKERMTDMVADIIVMAAVIAYGLFVIHYIYSRKKAGMSCIGCAGNARVSGGGCSGCGGNCSGCSGCSGHH